MKDYKHPKLNCCKVELKKILEKLIAENYYQSAKTVFDHIAHTGVEMDLHPELKEEPTMEEFLADE